MQSSLSSSPEQRKEVSAPSNERNDVVYKKGKSEKHTWRNKSTDSCDNAFYNFWRRQYMMLKPRIIKPETETLKWFSKHKNMPDSVSSLVRSFLVPKVPPNAINVDRVDKPNRLKKRQEQIHSAYLVLDGLAARDLRSYWAVFDTQDANRAFIAQVIPNSTRYSVCGGIWYFDDNGSPFDDRAFQTPVIEYFYDECFLDIPGPSNVSLCDQTLCFLRYSIRSELESVEVEGWVMEKDQLEAKFSGLEGWFDSEKDRYGSQARPIAPVDFRIIDGRWLGVVSNETSKWFFVDLRSIRKPNREGASSDATQYDCLEFPSSNDPVAVIEDLADVPSYEITQIDGYPIHCIKCNRKTACATMTFDNVYWPAGSGFCETCGIRFSKSSGCWHCWKLVQKTGPFKHLGDCHKVVTGPDYQCSENHASDDDMVFSSERTTRKRKRRWERDLIEIRAKSKDYVP